MQKQMLNNSKRFSWGCLGVLLLITLVAYSTAYAADPPKVTIIEPVVQSCSAVIEIHYDLDCATEVDVRVEISKEDGTLVAAFLEGDVGDSITSGTDKIITADLSNSDVVDGESLTIQIIAGIPMVNIPEDEGQGEITFQMGDSLNEGDTDELPVHDVILTRFAIDIYEVTNKRYAKFLNTTELPIDILINLDIAQMEPDEITGEFVPEEDYAERPVVGVSWFGAAAYAQWAGKRLPSEAQWEAAARGALEGKRYPWGDDEPSPNKANYSSNGTSPVGSFLVNGYGLYDIAGNVWEWCSDEYEVKYYNAGVPNIEDPEGPRPELVVKFKDNDFLSIPNLLAKGRVIRGGSYIDGNPINSLRNAYRTNAGPWYTSNTIGFRCSGPPVPPPCESNPVTICFNTTPPQVTSIELLTSDTGAEIVISYESACDLDLEKTKETFALKRTIPCPQEGELPEEELPADNLEQRDGTLVYPLPGDGVYEVTVQLADSTGCTEEPVTQTLTYDTTPPVIEASCEVTGDEVIENEVIVEKLITVTVTVTVTENIKIETGDLKIHYTIYCNEEPFGEGETDVEISDTACPWTFTYESSYTCPVTCPGDATIKVEGVVTGADSEGNEAEDAEFECECIDCCKIECAFEGVVTDTGDVPVPLAGAIVQAFLNGEIKGDATTGDDGKYTITFTDLPCEEKKYDLRAYKEGYIPELLPQETPAIPVKIINFQLLLLPTVEEIPYSAAFQSSGSQWISGTETVPLLEGDVILAIDKNNDEDPDNDVISGVAVVDATGAYNFHVYGDDPTTPSVDEGPNEGDVIYFGLNSFQSDSTSYTYCQKVQDEQLVPAEATWTAVTATTLDINFATISPTPEGNCPISIPYCSQWLTAENLEEITLEEGWNLISLHILPQYIGTYADTIPDVLCSIEGYYVMVQTYHNIDNIVKYPNPNIPDYPDREDEIYEGFPLDPGLKTFEITRERNDLLHLDPYHGYLIKATAPVTLTLASDMTVTPGKSEAAVDTPIVLHKGTNLVSYLPKEADSISHALSSIEGQYELVQTFIPGVGAKIWAPGFEELKNLEPNRGYWIRLKDDVETAELVYPTEGYAPVLEAPPAEGLVDMLSVAVTPTPISTAFWAAGTDLRIGDVITVQDSDGVVCGVGGVQRDGAFLVHVYGDDPTTLEDEGANAGERLQFFVNYQPVRLDSAPIFEPINIRRIHLPRPQKTALFEIPEKSDLFANYPNPFNPETWIPYQLANDVSLQIQIFDINGQLIRTFDIGKQAAGIYTTKEKAIYWDGRNVQGEQVASGVYFYHMRAGDFKATKRMFILR